MLLFLFDSLSDNGDYRESATNETTLTLFSIGLWNIFFIFLWLFYRKFLRSNEEKKNSTKSTGHSRCQIFTIWIKFCERKKCFARSKWNLSKRKWKEKKTVRTRISGWRRFVELTCFSASIRNETKKRNFRLEKRKFSHRKTEFDANDVDVCLARAEENDERLRSILTGRNDKQTRIEHFDRWSVSFFFFLFFFAVDDRSFSFCVHTSV